MAPRKNGVKKAPKTVGGNRISREYTLLLLIGLRILNALSVKTFFQPDEYFQSLEPAWEIAFGKDSGAWITWEWDHQLRSSLHPAIFAAAYFVGAKLATLLSLSASSAATLLIALPKVVQGAFAGVGDYFTCRLAGRVYGDGSNAALCALLLSVFSPWQWFCSTRTLSNSFEVVLTVIALYYWPWHITSVPETDEKSRTQEHSARLSVGDLRRCLLFAGFACILRPTNLLIWISLVVAYILQITVTGALSSHLQHLAVFTREGVLCGSLVLGISAISDRLYFGTWTFPPYHWLNFNITQSLAVFYGVNDWHYYLSQGLPLLLTTYLPFALAALWSSTVGSYKAPHLATATVRTHLTSAVLTMITALSTISHKEVRFIYPLLPILHVLAAPSVVSFFTTTNGNSTTSSTSPPSAQGIKLRGRWGLLLLAALITTNLTIGYYTTQLHQRGVIDVLDFLRHQYKEEYLPSSAPFSISNTLYNSTSSISSSTSPDLSSRDRARPFAAFLTPCHSTPWRSHLIHSDLHAWSLTCEPPLHIPASSPLRRSYRDEADRFYDDPQLFLSQEIGQKGREWPRYVVGFEGVGWWLAEFFMREPFREEGKGGEDGGMGVEKMELREVWRGFNSHWHDDWRRKGHVIVWEVVTVTPWETED